MGHFKQSLEMPKKSFSYQSGATATNEIIGWKTPKFHRVSRKTQLHPLSPHAHNFISIFYLCIMKTEQLLRCIFPEILADYFDVIDIQENIWDR